MAKKRRLKRRKGSQDQAQQTQQSNTTTVSSDDSNAVHSPRPSTEGSPSDHATSDGILTSMTSIMDTDEAPSDSSLHDDGDEEAAPSTYPASHYPRASSPHRTERPFPESHMEASDLASSTRSLWAQDLDYRYIHGRRYCRDYYMPNDELEQLRMALLHQGLLHILDGELTTVTLENPTHVLDVGTGTGDWAIRLAEILPHCEVVGTDISAIAETKSVPMNVFFEIEDAEDWDREPDFYDLIHFRHMEGSFADWPFMYDNVFYSLKPGGWIEIVDFDSAEGLMQFFSAFPPDSPLHALARDLEIGARKSGRTRGIGHLEPRVLNDCGFVDIRTTDYMIPITLAEESAGKIWLITCLDAIEATCLRLLTEQMEWDAEVCKAACESAARELANLAKDPIKSKDLVTKLKVVVARKPLDAPLAADYRAMGDTGSSSPDAMDEDSSQPTEQGAYRDSSSPSRAGSAIPDTGIASSPLSHGASP